MRLLAHIFIYLLPISFGQSANILGLFPLHVKSHFAMFERLLKSLAEKGHNVDVVTQFPSADFPPKYNQLSLAGSLPQLVNNLSVQHFDGFSHYETVEFMVVFGGVNVCEAVLKNPVMEELKRTQKKYDLVITEIFGQDCMLGFSHIFKTPVVSVISSVSLPWANSRIGNPDNPSYIPNYYVSSTDKMTLFERIENTLKLALSKFWYDLLSSEASNKLCKKFFGPDLPRLEQLALNTSLILVNSHFSISHARPTVPNFIEVGGLHIQKPKPLPKNFENLLATDSQGIIYLTMGSMVLTETFDYDKLQGIFDAFAELPYKVLWKATQKKFPKGLKIPNNIHFEEWLPQMEILCHPNVKLFISHGGLMGFQEAVYCGVPQLGIPLFADQVHNIKTGERKGLTIKVAYKDISKETILRAAKELLMNPIYKENCNRISQQFRDRPMSPLETAIFWVEYVIRHRGAPQLRTAGADLPWYQYYLVDVALVFISAMFAVMTVFIVLLRLIFRFVYCPQKKKID